MCILKIHANSQTATAIQAAAHNMDTILGDLNMLEKILISRERKIEAEAVRLAARNTVREQSRVWALWSEFCAQS